MKNILLGLLLVIAFSTLKSEESPTPESAVLATGYAYGQAVSTWERGRTINDANLQKIGCQLMQEADAAAHANLKAGLISVKTLASLPTLAEVPPELRTPANAHLSLYDLRADCAQRNK